MQAGNMCAGPGKPYCGGGRGMHIHALYNRRPQADFKQENDIIRF